MTARILTIDLERLPGSVPIFDARVRGGYIHPSRWTSYPTTLCFAAKWYGRKAVEFHATWLDPEAMLRRSWELYDEADIVVTYNGKKADNRWLRDDWAQAKMTPPSPWRDVDLYTVNKSTFGFESASLDHLCERLGLPRKVDHYDPTVARAAADGDAKAQARIKRYNVGDVRITEAAYEALRPWVKAHPNLGLYSGADKACSSCGSEDIAPNGWTRTALTTYALYRCNSCGANLRTAHRKNGAGIRGAS